MENKYILKWKEPKLYKNFKKNNRTRKQKIKANIIGPFIYSCLWLILWGISHLNPKSDPISFFYMLPLALVAGIIFHLLSKLAGYLFYDSIEFKNNILLFVANGAGNRIKYNNITHFEFKTEVIDNQEFEFLYFYTKNPNRKLRIELDKNIKKEEIIMKFNEKGIIKAFSSEK